MDWVFLLGGLLGLFLGGEALVRGSVGIARRMAISPLLIGLTVVGFGTSTPELLVSVDAALRGVPDIAIGNIIGSNIGNILLIVGLSALVWPIRVTGSTLRRDTAVMVLAALALIPLFWGADGAVVGHAFGDRPDRLSALGVSQARRKTADDDPAPMLPLWQAALWVALGLVALMVGARFLVDGAVTIARGYGISEAFIGVSIVAVGTSLPELATSLIAAFRRKSEIAIGNILGSNIFNVLGILGVTALIAPIPVAARFLSFDLPVMVAASLVLTGLLVAWSRIGRLTGIGLLLAYITYIWAAQG